MSSSVSCRTEKEIKSYVKEADKQKEKLTGILYGAGHMKTICRYLIDQLGYVPYNGKLLKVFTI